MVDFKQLRQGDRLVVVLDVGMGFAEDHVVKESPKLAVEVDVVDEEQEQVELKEGVEVDVSVISGRLTLDLIRLNFGMSADLFGWEIGGLDTVPILWIERDV